MVKVIDRQDLMLIEFEEVGDGTRYYVAVGRWPMSTDVYVALGGRYAPYTGGFFPEGVLIQFNKLINDWAAEQAGPDFYHALTDSGPRSGFYWYMDGKQRVERDKVNKWDLTVAFIIAWLYWLHPSLVQSEPALKIIGATYQRHHKEAREILVEIYEAVELSRLK